MVNYLEKNWNNLTNDLPHIKNSFYQTLTSLYNSKNRFYHNLNHIEALLKLSQEYKHLLKSPKTVDFTIWYHDTIYNASETNNEEKSAELASEHLTGMGIDESVILNCYRLIIATKKHEVPNDLNTFDAKFLLDIDLSILAAPQDAYLQYSKQIRKEYKVYPDFLYKQGRKKVLEHFLEMENIYKTDLFQKLWENKAKENINYELKLLS